jgi:hypothetical protein
MISSALKRAMSQFMVDPGSRCIWLFGASLGFLQGTQGEMTSLVL